FAYVSADGVAQVVSEGVEEVTGSLVFEIAQVFPHYVVFVGEGKIFMKVNPVGAAELEDVETDSLLTPVAPAHGVGP
ncbi:cystathionine beta-lyase, partial [Streptococcus suis]